MWYDRMESVLSQTESQRGAATDACNGGTGMMDGCGSLTPGIRKSGRWTDENDREVRSDGCNAQTKLDKNGRRGGELETSGETVK